MVITHLQNPITCSRIRLPISLQGRQALRTRTGRRSYNFHPPAFPGHRPRPFRTVTTQPGIRHEGDQETCLAIFGPLTKVEDLIKIMATLSFCLHGLLLEDLTNLFRRIVHTL